MTLIPLTHRNFVKNKVQSLLKVEYKDSDPTTYIYDQDIDSKSLINIEPYKNITDAELGIDPTDPKRQEAQDFFGYVDENKFFFKNYEENTTGSITYPDNSSVTYFSKKNELSANLINDNIKSYNFKNKYKIDRIEQKFLPDSFELQKKNYVKNNLYRDYKEDYSLDYYNNLNYGFCNWNSINFFSQRFNNNINHTNSIIWPNSKTGNNKNQYDFIRSESFNLSFCFNLRKNVSDYNRPECIIHVPDVISIYSIKGYNTLQHKLAVVLFNNTKDSLRSNITNITNDFFETDNNFPYISSGNVFITDNLDILNNRWYNLSFNLNKNNLATTLVQIYIDGTRLVEQELTTSHSSIYNGENSFICLGNRPKYVNTQNNNFPNYDHVFYQLFGREFDKDYDLGKDNSWISSDSGIDPLNNLYDGNITFEKNINEYSESFHGEIHDIRIYSKSQTEDYIANEISKKTIKDLSALEELEFYVPVFYIPYYVKKKSSFNAFSTKMNLRYSCMFNPFLANTCGGLEVSSENYLSDFIKHTKPNVVIGGSQVSHVYRDFLTTSISSFTSHTDDVADIKKGVLQKSIYNKNLKDSTHTSRDLNIDANISYKNLLILPNDNGALEVNFEPINSILTEYKDNTIKIDSTLIDKDKLFNISVEDIHKDKEYNYSFTLDDSLKDNVRNIQTSTSASEKYKINISTVNEFSGLDEETANRIITDIDRSKSVIDNFSNFIFHDNRIINISSIDNIDNFYSTQSNEYYQVTKSNPIFRLYKQDISEVIDNLSLDSRYAEDSINYFKLPIPYSVINRDYDSIFSIIIDIPSKFYNKKIEKNTFEIEDTNISTSNNNINLKFSDNKKGMLYRNNCLTKVADWNYVGHIFYKDGLASLNRPELTYFGEDDFICNFKSNSFMYVHEINIPVDKGLFDKSLNETYDKNLRHDESAFNSEEEFVYITDINLHDENLNIIAKAKLASPAVKKASDSILFRLKMDY